MRLGDLPKVTQKVAKCVLICHDFSIPFSMTIHCQICFLKWTFFIPWKSGLRCCLVICVFKEINYWFIFSFIYPLSLYISHICNFKKTPCISLWLLTQIAQVDWAPVLVKDKDEGIWSLRSYKLILSAFFFMLWFNKRQLSSVCIQFSSVAQSCPTLRPRESQHTRPPCLSPAPRVYSNSYPSSRWCHPAISSSVVPFSSCPQSLPASESFPMSQLSAWGGQSIGVSALASVLPKNTQDWSPLGWTGWISLQSKGLSRIFSNTTVQKNQFFGAQLSL